MSKSTKNIFKFLIISIITVLAIFSCGKKEETKENMNTAETTKKIKITTTTTMLVDLVKTIGGDKVEVTGLMGEGVDPHLYAASAGDIEKLSNADIVVYGGLHLEGKMTEIFEKLSSQNKKVLNVGEALDKNKIMFEDENTPDPHVWFDTELWARQAEAVEAELSKNDPSNSEYYKENLEKYKAELIELTNYVKGRIDEIPEKSRVLVTAHDAFGYFAKQFGLEVKAIQGVSTDSETGSKNITDLANFIVENNIKAIFVESSVPKKSIEALQEAVKAKGKEVKIGGELYSDSLGDEASNTETYIKTVKANADIIANALK
ncbi:MAG: zinc ABC transporter substrate-binding protein [Leptotrichiaceae bacterium]|nr:zinc ABC transporter substrate-binding protein [Leptotrichiaceae bacterium]